MEKYDVVIVGGATSGAYFAKKMADMGHSVKVIESSSPENLGRKMDIFHVSKTDLKTFDIPFVKEGDPEWAFEFTENHFSSPSNKYTINTTSETVGLHLHEYTSLMAEIAVDAGAEYEYSASFKEFVFENGVICGIRYNTEDGLKEIRAATVVDCSGSAAVCRCALPNGYGVENFKLTNRDLFYVILRYVKFDKPEINTFWLNTKSWYAPFSMNSNEKIIGTGAIASYENCERTYKKLDEVSSKGNFELVKTEKGTTPYRRPPYSLVADNFIAAGDAACLTKPDCGEGVTSSMVMMDIAADVLDKALKCNDTGKNALWKINKEYNRVQGADFSLVRAFLTNAVRATDDEMEYCFASGIINEKFLNNGKITASDILNTVKEITSAIAKKHISGATIGAVLKGAKYGVLLRQHYMNFPDTPAGFEKWCAKSDKYWHKVGTIPE